MDENFAIQLFEGKKVRIVWDAEQEKYYFAVADIVQILTDSTDVKQYIKRMRARDPELNSKWGTICTPIRMMDPYNTIKMKEKKNETEHENDTKHAFTGSRSAAEIAQ